MALVLLVEIAGVDVGKLTAAGVAEPVTKARIPGATGAVLGTVAVMSAIVSSWVDAVLAVLVGDGVAVGVGSPVCARTISAVKMAMATANANKRYLYNRPIFFIILAGSRAFH